MPGALVGLFLSPAGLSSPGQAHGAWPGLWQSWGALSTHCRTHTKEPASAQRASHRSLPGTGHIWWQGICEVPAPKPGPGLGTGGARKCSTGVALEAQRGTTTGPRPHSEAGLIPPVSSCCSSRGNQGGGLGTWSQPVPAPPWGHRLLQYLVSPPDPAGETPPGPAGRGAQGSFLSFLTCLLSSLHALPRHRAAGCSLLSPESQS